MVIFSLQGNHDGSACIVKDGKVIAFIATERITRRKKDRGITEEVFDYILKCARLKPENIDYVAIVNWFGDAVNGKELWDKEGVVLAEANGVPFAMQTYRSIYDSATPVNDIPLKLDLYGHEYTAFIIDHHFAHNAAAFYNSPFDKAACLSVDFSDGLGRNHMVGILDRKKGDWQLIRTGNDFNVGGVYGEITDFLGFYPSLDGAGKVMALAALADPDVVQRVNAKQALWPELRRTVVGQDLYAALLLRNGQTLPPRRVFYPQLPHEGGTADPGWLKATDWDSDASKNLAGSLQAVLEDSLLCMINMIHDELAPASDGNLCLSGGTMLNVVANGKIREFTPYDEGSISLFPACGDDGLSVGAALHLHNRLQIETAIPKPSISEIIEGGMTYDDIAEVAKGHKKIMLDSEGDAAIERAAAVLEDGKVVAWFEGGSEVGPRALGRRSILADARDPKMQDHLNRRVKKREGFRPYAPIVLADSAGEWFDSGCSSPFMLFSTQVKSKDLPAITHADGSARYQTVTEENGKIHDLLVEFNGNTGVPVLVNTSFNVQGEPIVETPEDAFECFIGTEIDYLWIDGSLYGKAAVVSTKKTKPKAESKNPKAKVKAKAKVLSKSKRNRAGNPAELVSADVEELLAEATS